MVPNRAIPALGTAVKGDSSERRGDMDHSSAVPAFRDVGSLGILAAAGGDPHAGGDDADATADFLNCRRLSCPPDVYRPVLHRIDDTPSGSHLPDWMSWAALAGKPLRIAYLAFSGTRDQRLGEVVQRRLGQSDLLPGGVNVDVDIDVHDEVCTTRHGVLNKISCTLNRHTVSTYARSANQESSKASVLMYYEAPMTTLAQLASAA